MTHNEKLINATKDYNKANWLMKMFKKGGLIKVAKDRKEYLKQLIKEGKIQEALVVIYGTIASFYPQEIQEYLEKFVISLMGEYSLICHNHETHGSLVHYLAVGKGKDKKHYRLESTPDKTPINETGDLVEVHGHIIDEYLILGGKPTGKGKPPPPPPPPNPTPPPPSGAKKIIYFLINFKDKLCPFDPTYVATTTSAISNLYNETSFGAITSVTCDVRGPYTIPNLSTEACNFQAWGDAADLVINATGFDRSQYTNVCYLFPQTGCGIGYGTVGGSPAKMWLFKDYVDLFGHEFGHNLGMQHAGDAGNQYNDYSDIMGYSGIGLRQVNACHKVERGWSSAVVATPGNYTLFALEYSFVTPAVLTILKPDTNEKYYICFRATIGFDSFLASYYANKVNIYKKANTSIASQTYFIRALSDGEVFEDTINNVKVQALSHTNNSADIKIF